ncbi:MAG: hypothetical protein ACLF0P_15245 [Thermoanaerobaculia bacterium]
MRVPQPISDDHPLRLLFRELVSRRFGEAGWEEDDSPAYVGDLMTDFVHVDNLYRIRDGRGRKLQTVAEMLVESNPLLGDTDFPKEREVRRHVGDFTLFFTGLFPELLESLGIMRRRMGADVFVDYIQAGKESYRMVAEFDRFHGTGRAAVFTQLAHGFEVAVYALNRVRDDLNEAHLGVHGRVREILG